MSIISIKITTSLSLKKLFRSPLLPVFSFLTSFLALSLSAIYLSHQSPAFATPPPPPTPITLSASISHPVVTLNFKAGDLATSAFKQFRTTYDQTTNNPTGATSYISSIDEETSLTHNLTTIPQKIETISSELSETNFTLNHWGYRSNQVPGGTNVNFKPIPKASSPDPIISTQDTSNARAHIDFGARLNLSLPAGTYSKNILLTAITNHVPKTATFISGPDFATQARTITNASISAFKKSSTAPAPSANPLTVSTPDSEVPIYLWMDGTNLYWWSEADTVYTHEDCSAMFAIVPGSTYSGIAVDMRGINTSRTKNMQEMFAYVKPYSDISSVDLSEFTTNSAENMFRMFYGSKYTSDLDLSGFSVNNVTNMSEMFRDSSFQNLNLSSLNTSHVTNMYRMFQGTRARSINLSGFNTSHVTDMQGMFNGFSHDYSGTTPISPIPLNLSSFDTSQVVNMELMFSAANLDHLDLSTFNTANVANMRSMFAFTTANSINVSGFNTSNVTDMSWMFQGAKNLTSLDLSNFSNQKVTDMNYMFANTTNLRNLNLTNFRTGSVVNMAYMFSEAVNLPTLDLSSFDTRNVENMGLMFFGSVKLNNLNLSNFNTSKVKTMNGMFKHCEGLTNLNLSSFDTRNVTDMKDMFYATFMTPENGVLDISSFDTSRLGTVVGMFFYSKMRTIYVSNRFVTTAVSTPQDPFLTNTNLVGGNGTAYVYPNNGHTYMRIDAPGQPGYFTLKP